MASQKSLYALFVGLNKYSDPEMNLKGCVDDLEEMKNYLFAHFNNDQFSFFPKVLKDEDATRANIVNGFHHFDKAKDGDVCLFHFTGHGSQCITPPEFQHLAVNNRLSTLVCYDSRMPGERDLIDKELSYLIWKSQMGKQLQFITIIDACNSGGVTRDDYSKIRSIGEPFSPPKIISDLVGVQHYTKSRNGHYTPPIAHHILLSASRSNETAKEVYVNGKPRGIFSYCLVETLKEAHNQISYSDLIKHVRIMISNKVREQTPQLEVTRNGFEYLVFLKDTPLAQAYAFALYYDPLQKKWLLDAGALHGIEPKTKESPTVLDLEGFNGKEVQVTQVFSTYSIVSGVEDLPRDKKIRARPKRMLEPMFSLAFDKDNDKEGEDLLKKEFEQYDFNNFSLVNEDKTAQFLVHAKQDYFFLTTLDQPINDLETQRLLPINRIRGIFKKIPDYTDQSAQIFFSNLEKMAFWQRSLALNNPTSCIQDSAIKVRFYQSLMPGVETNDVPTAELDIERLLSLVYETRDGQWHRPTFKLEIENRSNKKLFVSLLYFSHNYSITNILIPQEELQPGEKVAAKYIANDTTNFTIPVMIEEEYLNWGINKVKCYLKLFIATEYFETTGFNQAKIIADPSPEIVGKDRTLPFTSVHSISDWRTKEICLEIIKPVNITEKTKTRS